MSTSALVAGFLVSTAGLGFLLYAKKQQRAPQLVTGMALMACPFVAPTPEWTACLSGALLTGLWFALRAGW